MSEFNQCLLDIHEEISIRDEDRQPYTKMYQIITKWLMDNMKKIDPLFNELFKGLALFGSYPNRVRIIEPREFDVSMLLLLPYPLEIFSNPVYAGFVRISRQEHYANEDDREIFTGNSLDRLKIKEWINSIINCVLSKVRPPNGYSIQYTCCNVAHNIYAKEEGKQKNKTISIDFVPSIMLEKDDISPLVNEMKIPGDYMKTFLAIPKCVTGFRDRLSTPYYDRRLNMFRLVNPEAERDMIWDRQNLKVVYRLLKSIRDNYKLQRLKSYFLTAAFLLEVDRQPDWFWHKPVYAIFFHMLNLLIEYLKQNVLPFYWDQDYNLLSILKKHQRIRYHNVLLEVYEDLQDLCYRSGDCYDEIESHFKVE